MVFRFTQPDLIEFDHQDFSNLITYSNMASEGNIDADACMRTPPPPSSSRPFPVPEPTLKLDTMAQILFFFHIANWMYILTDPLMLDTAPFMLTKTIHRDVYPAIDPVQNPGVSAEGKVAIVTGATGGLGFVGSSPSNCPRKEALGDTFRFN